MITLDALDKKFLGVLVLLLLALAALVALDKLTQVSAEDLASQRRALELVELQKQQMHRDQLRQIEIDQERSRLGPAAKPAQPLRDLLQTIKDYLDVLATLFAGAIIYRLVNRPLPERKLPALTGAVATITGVGLLVRGITLPTPSVMRWTGAWGMFEVSTVEAGAFIAAFGLLVLALGLLPRSRAKRDRASVPAEETAMGAKQEA